MLDVKTYYQNTRFDYRMVWGHPENLAMHFGYYDEHADKHRAALSNMNRAMADLVEVQAGEHVLDAGCGIGSASFWLEENRGAQVTGISIVPAHIEDCQRNARKRGSQNTTFLEADFCKTPFPDATFDVVWACESQCHAERKIDFYREVYRILKPGGRLIVADYIRAGRPLPAHSETLLQGWLHPQAISDIDTQQEHAAHLQSAGFQPFEIKDVTPNVRVSLRNLHDLCRKWLTIGKVLRFLGIVSQVRMNNVYASMTQYKALQENAWMYVMIVGKK